MKCFSYLAEDAAYVLAARHVTRMVKVLHDGVKLDWYLLIFFQIAASKLGVLLTEDQWLPGLERRLEVQTLGVTAPLPGPEEQQQDGEKEVREEGVLQITGLRGHGAKTLSLSLGQFGPRSNNHSSLCVIFHYNVWKEGIFVVRQSTCYISTSICQAQVWDSKFDFVKKGVLIWCPGLRGFRQPCVCVWVCVCWSVNVCIKHTASHLPASWQEKRSELLRFNSSTQRWCFYGKLPSWCV